MTIVFKELAPPAPAPEPAQAEAPARAYLGEVEELGSLLAEHMVELHNLTLAAARAEFVLVREESALAVHQGSPSGGAGARSEERGRTALEYLEALAKAVIEHLVRLKDWIVESVKHIVNSVFQPRNVWLAKAKHELLARTDFGGRRVSLGSQLLKPRGLGDMVVGLRRAVSTAAREVRDINYGRAEASGFEKAFNDWGIGVANAESIPRGLRDHYIGARQEEVELTAPVVKNLVGLAEETFQTAHEMGEVNREIDEVIAEARRDAQGDESSAQARGARLRAISVLTKMVTICVSGATAVNSIANHQAVAALHTAFLAKPRESAA